MARKDDRLRVFVCLLDCDERSAISIADELDLPLGSVTNHIKALRGMGLVCMKVQAKKNQPALWCLFRK